MSDSESIATRQSLLSRLKNWNDQESWRRFFDTYWMLIYVSRKHALLTERHGAIWIEDLGSKHGTVVNGKEIQNQGEWRSRPGDLIVMGETTLRVEIIPETSPPQLLLISARSGAAGKFHILVALDFTAQARPIPAYQSGEAT